MSTERLEVSRGPRVILVEDDETTRFLAENSLLRAGIEVVLGAETLGEIFDWARQDPKEKTVVLVLGGHLLSELKGRKGRKIERLIREELPGVKIVALSFDKRSVGDTRVSLEDFLKRKVDLGEVVREIT